MVQPQLSAWYFVIVEIASTSCSFNEYWKDGLEGGAHKRFT